MSRRTVTVAIVCAAALLAVGASVAKWRDTRTFYLPSSLLSRFPAEDAIALSLNVESLRAGGLLGPSKAPQEAEYKQFLAGSGFDYRRDLDFALASFSTSGNYFIARGRFNWAKLREYTAKQGGSCYQDLCRMQGSTADRRISFLPLRPDTIALAVSTDDLAATRLTHTSAKVSDPLPPGPAWLTIPGAVLRQPGGLPSGLRVVFSGLMQANRVVFSANGAASGIAVNMDAPCKSETDARILLSQLQNSVSLLKEAAARNKTESSPLSTVLMGGSFSQNGPRVTGKWVLGKDLIDTLTAGL